MVEDGSTARQVIEKIGGASRDRTDDLIVANDGTFHPCRSHLIDPIDSPRIFIAFKAILLGQQWDKVHCTVGTNFSIASCFTNALSRSAARRWPAGTTWL